jgi:hypothetical protein
VMSTPESYDSKVVNTPESRLRIQITSRIFEKKSKSLLGLPHVTRISCFFNEKITMKKSLDTVPLHKLACGFSFRGMKGPVIQGLVSLLIPRHVRYESFIFGEMLIHVLNSSL